MFGLARPAQTATLPPRSRRTDRVAASPARRLPGARTRGRALLLAAMGMALTTAIVAPASSASSYGEMAWGNNRYGQLGDETRLASDVPVAVSGLSGVISVAGGGSHNLALLGSGTVMGSGANLFGQLCNGTRTRTDVPVAMSDVSGAVAIAAGSSHSLALMSNGTVVACGENLFGQLGDGAMGGKRQRPAGGRQWPDRRHGHLGQRRRQSRAAGRRHGDGVGREPGRPARRRQHHRQRHPGAGEPARRRDRHLSRRRTRPGAAEQRHGHGLGRQSARAARQRHPHQQRHPRPRERPEGSHAVSAGGDSCLALLRNGTIMAWGDNDFGQLGNGRMTESDVPVPVSGLTASRPSQPAASTWSC